PPPPGRRGSSTRPHKQNPVLSVLVSSAALQAPALAALLHTAAGRTVDERPPGAWHAECLPLQHLLRSTVVSASQAAELVDGLVVDTDAMARHAEAVASDLLAERGDGPGDPRTYLGATDALIDAALARWKEFDDGA
ncbi:MAG: lyase family protein, partial [Jatrophihabitans sp.]